MTPADSLGHLSKLPVTVDVALDCGTLPLASLLGWTEGVVIRSTRPAGDSVDVHVGGRLIGSGEIVPMEGAMGVRITNLRDNA